MGSATNMITATESVASISSISWLYYQKCFCRYPVFMLVPFYYGWISLIWKSGSNSSALSLKKLLLWLFIALMQLRELRWFLSHPDRDQSGMFPTNTHTNYWFSKRLIHIEILVSKFEQDINPNTQCSWNAFKRNLILSRSKEKKKQEDLSTVSFKVKYIITTIIDFKKVK